MHVQKILKSDNDYLSYS